MKTLLLVGMLFTIYLCTTRADEASQLGPEERRTLLADDDDVFTDTSPRRYSPNYRQRDCARKYEDCSFKECCSACIRCSCDRSGKNCRCNGESQLALFLGLCRN
ncbi:uncharacterized protein LOC129988825 isoform X1 [Argiope bruennichi]|uniref:uncharacterized protein LOC129988825 isoform X1 n=1 Tax=Argiope bruennichi TaxID=94029 RepID=UPI002493E967|nr:uncharacterized protein LOC129988825 isoform X1 [Argiope bruennichi]